MLWLRSGSGSHIHFPEQVQAPSGLKSHALAVLHSTAPRRRETTPAATAVGFFLELLVLVLLVAAAAGPQLKLPYDGRPLIVILDDSVSMRAVSQNQSAQARAREFLERLLRHQQPPSMRLILAGKESRITGPTIRTRAELIEQLKQWQCRSPAAALDQAVALAAELGRGRANVLVLTDHAPPDANVTSDRLQWCAFGVPAANVALVNATRAPHSDKDRCMLEVYNCSASIQRTRLAVYAGTNTLQTTQLELGPRERQRLVFSIAATVPMLRAELEPDALAEDNQVQLLPPQRKRVRVRVALTNSVLAGLVERTLEATGLRAATSENPELVVHQSHNVPVGARTWTLRVSNQKTRLFTSGRSWLTRRSRLPKGCCCRVWFGLCNR